MRILNDEEILKLQVEYTNNPMLGDSMPFRNYIAQAQHQQDLKDTNDLIDSLEPPVIIAKDKTAFYAGFQMAKESLKQLVEG